MHSGGRGVIHFNYDDDNVDDGDDHDDHDDHDDDDDDDDDNIHCYVHLGHQDGPPRGEGFTYDV